MENRKLVTRASLGTLDTAVKTDENRLRAKSVDTDSQILEELRRWEREQPAPKLV